MSAAPPKFLIKPRTQYVKEGETATLRCLCKGQPPPKVKWEKDGQTIEPSPKYRVYTKNQFNCLDIVNANVSDRGIFVCVITNSIGTASEPVDVDVAAAAPTATQERRDSGAAAGQAASSKAVSAAAAATELPLSTGDAIALRRCQGGGAQPVSPRFTKHLNREEEVVEGDTVIIEVKSGTWFDEIQERHVLPRFTKLLENCDVSEGDAVTLECRGAPATPTAPSAGHSASAYSSCRGAPSALAQRDDSHLSGAGVAASDASGPACRQVSHGFPLSASSLGDDVSDWQRLVDAASARPQFVKELANLVLTEGDSVTIRCVTNGADVEAPAGAAIPEADDRRSFANGEESREASSGRRPASTDSGRREYGAPFFIIQLPSALTLEEGADMDVSCHVNNSQVEPLHCLDKSIPSF